MSHLAPQTAEPTAQALAIIGKSSCPVWSEDPGQRLKRAFAREGITQVLDESALLDHAGAVLGLRADCVLDAPVVKALAQEAGIALLASEGGAGAGDGVVVAVHACAGEAGKVAAVLRGEVAPATAGFKAVTTQELASNYWHALRKREIPYAILLDPSRMAAIEWRMFMGTYKGATDLVTKWLWPWPAFHATRFCIRFGLSPNMVTWASLVLVLVALWAFWQGHYLSGLTAGWLMTFLDTVDGKLARITLTSSKFGNALDHGIDLVHPPFWYVAWCLGLMGTPLALSSELFYGSLAVILGGYLLQRIMEGLSILLFKIEIHVWRPIDTLFRQITARRNPNMVLLTAFSLLGRPDWGIVSVAVWTGLCLLAHGLQLFNAWVVFRRQGKLTSWMTAA